MAKFECRTCKNSGLVPNKRSKPCRCGGTGIMLKTRIRSCYTCSGSGKVLNAAQGRVEKVMCFTCNGTGKLAAGIVERECDCALQGQKGVFFFNAGDAPCPACDAGRRESIRMAKERFARKQRRPQEPMPANKETVVSEVAKVVKTKADVRRERRHEKKGERIVTKGEVLPVDDVLGPDPLGSLGEALNAAVEATLVLKAKGTVAHGVETEKTFCGKDAAEMKPADASLPVCKACERTARYRELSVVKNS